MVEGGSERIPFLLTIVFVAMLLGTPVFGAVASRIARKDVAPIVFLFFAAYLMVFFGVLSNGVSLQDLASTFFVWFSVFNLFVVSAFWIVMVDIFQPDQATRLFAAISAGGTLGGIAGPALAGVWAKEMGIEGVVLASAALVLLALLSSMAARACAHGASVRSQEDRPIGHSIFSGIANILRSKYLTTIVAWVLVGNILTTFFYLQQQELIKQEIADPIQRFALLARVDAVVNAAAVLIQTFFAASLVKRFGVGLGLVAASVPAFLGSAALLLLPILVVAIVAQGSVRALNFAMSLPARHMLFSVVTPDEKYKSQSFVDTVVQRGGDAAGAWAFAGLLRTASLDISAIAGFAAVVALGWASFGLAIGEMWKQRRYRGSSD